MIAIIPFGVPASGKSTIWSILREQINSMPGWSTDSVSSDEIRGTVIKELMKENPKLSKKAAFNQSARRSESIYRSEM